MVYFVKHRVWWSMREIPYIYIYPTLLFSIVKYHTLERRSELHHRIHSGATCPTFMGGERKKKKKTTTTHVKTHTLRANVGGGGRGGAGR